MRTAKILECADMIRALKADVAVSVNYSGVIPGKITDLFPLGVLNAHGGDLPRYRGNACQAWAIINGEDQIGLCIHRMIGGELDSGDLLARAYFPVDETTKIAQAWSWMNQQIPALYAEALARLDADPSYILEVQSKHPADALRCFPRRPEDGRIDWTKPAVQVVRLINASGPPYAGAFCEFEGQKMIVWDASVLRDAERFCAVPGQILNVQDDFVDVACGEGKVRISSVRIGDADDAPRRWISSVRSRLT
jgi:UDP-4-amino-4-deoxy-L-arabinose formyltransferase/UDP-glucuronic acid dehydrogenase (UDP-4-keto-hexauronic acid decarboxylating)